MSKLIASSHLTAIVGMGVTGISVARFLSRENKNFIMFDTRQEPENLQAFIQEFPDVPYVLGDLSDESLMNVNEIILSPGLDIKEPVLQKAIERGVSIVGDIQLFIDAIDKPLIAITGSNAKTTVTTLVGEMIAAAGKKVKVGGNIGVPALDLLGDPEEKTDFFVLELSSFQLETIRKTNAEVATILNLSADHMDRYAGLAEYHKAKQRIYFGAKKIVLNRDDPLTQPPIAANVKITSFGLSAPDIGHFGLIEESGTTYIAFGLKKLMSVSELKIVGQHNYENALAALAVVWSLGLEIEPALQVLRSFIGLPHRCQLVASVNGVVFINDSKGTNVGATLAAIEGLSSSNSRLVLIAGGEGKDANFKPLIPVFKEHVAALISIGRDASLLEDIAQQAGVVSQRADNLEQAVSLAYASCGKNDTVLLSPACASFDMFKNYLDRGEKFIAAVNDLVQQGGPLQ